MKGYRTVIFNILMAGGTLLGMEMTPELAGEYTAALVVVLGLGNVILRSITNTPMFKKE